MAGVDWHHEYRKNVERYELLKGEISFALNRELVAREIKTHSVTARVKTEESLAGKAERKDYANPLEDAEDVVGARVVVLFLADLPRAEEAILGLFDVLGTEDRIETEDPSSFGYMSRHYTARIKHEHAGPRYDSIRDVTFEVQLRTILMDAWANVSHYLAYKGEASIPEELRRDFHALSGLFYVADKHFEMFFSRALDVQHGVTHGISAGTSQPVELNLDTLAALLRTRFEDRGEAAREDVAYLLEDLLDLGYRTSSEVDRLVEETADAFVEAERALRSVPYFGPVGVVRRSLRIKHPEYEERLKARALPRHRREKRQDRV